VGEEKTNPITPVQMRMARAAVGWGIWKLAEKAGMTARTIARIESGSRARQSTLAAIRSSLESAGIEFTEENGRGPGVRLRKTAGESAE
jgi:predicted transcriptional regulator